MGLTLFTENNINRKIDNFIIPPQWIMNVISFAIIIAAPMLASFFKNLRQKGFKITIAKQFTASLYFIGFGLLILPIGIKLADKMGYVNLGFIITSYVFQGLGEVLMAPIGFAMIGQIIPRSLHSIMMGIWLIIVGIGAVFADLFSKYAIDMTKSSSPIITNPQYFKSFLTLSIIAISAAIILSIFMKWINRLVKE